MVWTQFSDSHSGGGQKLTWGHIFIEAPQDEARLLFMEAFGRDPDNITCACCGRDFSVFEDATLEEATAFHRDHGGGMPFDEFLADPHFMDFGRRVEVKIVARPHIREAP